MAAMRCARCKKPLRQNQTSYVFHLADGTEEELCAACFDARCREPCRAPKKEGK